MLQDRQTNIYLVALLFLAGLKIGGIVWFQSAFKFRTYTYLGNDHPRVWPVKLPESQVLIPVHDTVRYQLDSDDGAAEWAASFPGNGLLYLGEQCRPFSISMFHQIRCLDIIRRSFVDVRSRNATTSRRDSLNGELTRHCLNYLRQMVFCRSHSYLDPVLGYPIPNAHPDTDQCRDWSTLYEEVRRTQQRCRV